MYDGKVWFYILLRKSDSCGNADFDSNLSLEMIKPGCGMVISAKDDSIRSDMIDVTCITELIKEFGVIILRGFQKMKSEEELISLYSKRCQDGMVPWDFGILHKVMVDDRPGFVNSFQAGEQSSYHYYHCYDYDYH